MNNDNMKQLKLRSDLVRSEVLFAVFTLTTIAGILSSSSHAQEPWNPEYLAFQDSDLDSVPDHFDGCPFEPSRTSPGPCGCQISDDDCLVLNDPAHHTPIEIPTFLDSDLDGISDEQDGCPYNSSLTLPNQCGCELDEASCELLQSPVYTSGDPGVFSFYPGQIDHILPYEEECARFAATMYDQERPLFGPKWMKNPELRQAVVTGSTEFKTEITDRVIDNDLRKEILKNVDDLIEKVKANDPNETSKLLKDLYERLDSLKMRDLSATTMEELQKDSAYLLKRKEQFKKLRDFINPEY